MLTYTTEQVIDEIVKGTLEFLAREPLKSDNTSVIIGHVLGMALQMYFEKLELAHKNEGGRTG